MRGNGDQVGAGVRPMSMIFPSLFLGLAPLCDLARLLTRNPVWPRAAFFVAFFCSVAAAVSVLPELIDWLATDRHTRARRAGAAPLTLHVAALVPLAASVIERLRAGAAGFDPWSFVLACLGALAWLSGSLMAAERVARRYQPTGAPFSS